MALTDQLVVALPMQDTQPITALVDVVDTGNNLTPSTKPGSGPSPTYLAWGRNAVDSTQKHQGLTVAYWGKWDRIISGAEIATLYNSGSGRTWSAISAGSLNDAKFYLNFDEASASSTIADKTGRGNTATVGGAMTTTTGPGGTGAAANFATSTDFCTCDPTADTNIPAATSFSFAGWVKLASLSAVSGQLIALASKWTGVSGSNNNSPEYGLYLNRHGADASAVFQIDLGTGVQDTPTYCNNCAVSGTSHPSTGTWYFLVMVYDAAANECKLYVDGTLESTLSVVVNPDMVSALGGLAAKFSNTVWDGVSGNGYDVSGPRNASRASNADYGIGNTDATVSFWVRRTRTLAGTEELIIKGVAPAAFDWDFRFATNVLYFEMSDSGGSNFRYAAWSSTITDTNWHHVVGWHVQSTGKCWISVDDGTPVEGTATGAFTPATNASVFSIGGNAASTTNQFLGEIRSFYKWTRVLTAGERTELYGAGTPLDYPFGSTTPSMDWLPRLQQRQPTWAPVAY